MEYFKSEYITKNIIRIRDIMDVAMYLVIGEKEACLLDTGNGFGDISKYVQTLTNKPVFVILTHGHFDHVGGAVLFDKVYMNPKDIEVYQEHSSISYRQNFYSKIPQLKEIPIEEYNSVRQEPFLPLEDGQVFDLGGISIKVIEVPGHTQGMMMVLIPEEEIILFGDACGVSVLLFEDCSSTVSDYKKALLRLKKEYSSCYKRVIRNHGSFESPVVILDNVISCCDDILNKRDDHVDIEVFEQKGFFKAKKTDSKGERLDGEQGNIIYRFDKAI